jgi:drug/metabolite transporter (DMT)-like permease
MDLLQNWIFLSGFAAITFGIGDFIVVLSEQKNMDVFTLYMTYNILVGLLSFVYLFVMERNSFDQIINFSNIEWLIVFAFSFFYFFAYMSHFRALQKAPNPGYSNTLIMFHVVVLTLLSYYFINKPLNWKTVVGILVTFIGAYIVTVNA